MRFSVESRVPFLTLNIAQLALSLPEKFLISAHGETKHVLREALKGIVPKEILDRKDKIGFAVPDSLWIGKRRESIRRILEQNARPEILDTSLIISLFDKWDPNKPRNSMPVWRWVNFLRWIHLSEL
jgi:asparagine synthase (glutamine-hydrolysing)